MKIRILLCHVTQCSKRSSQRCENRQGFTLLETLVALALCGILISAIGGATHLYWKYRAVTQEDVQAAHLLRGIAEDLTVDLRAAMAPTPKTPAKNSESDSRSPHASLTTDLKAPQFGQEQFLNLMPHGMITPIHFVGTNRTLAILTEATNYRFSAANAASLSARARHIVWWVNTGSSLRIPLALNNYLPTYSTFSATGLPTGLVRATQDFHPVDRSSESDKHQPKLVCQGVTALTFRYFDGQRWHTDWDSDRSASIPSLVEITLTLPRDQEPRRTIVVAIPQGRHW